MDKPSLQDERYSEYADLLDTLTALRCDIIEDAYVRLKSIDYEWPEQERLQSAVNLAMYLAFRKHDIRPLQERLTRSGLSSLGRGESNIIDNIDHVINMLSVATGIHHSEADTMIPGDQNYSGKQILSDRSDGLFGKAPETQYTRIMTTMPSEAAFDYELIKDFIEKGMNCARINCAHDDVDSWQRMVAHIQKAVDETGRECRVFMDLAGTKIRTGKIGEIDNDVPVIRLFEGDECYLSYVAKNSMPEYIDPVSGERSLATISCNSDIFLNHVSMGDSVWFDDGKLGCVIEGILPQGLRLRVTHAGPKGVRIREYKGINFPDSAIDMPALTDKDMKDLDFICKNADMVGLSFVQSECDLDVLMTELEKRQCLIAIIAKIETRQAIENMPAVLFKSLSYAGKFGVMIARGDLAVELGSVRMAEIQEELLWLCEAAHTPVIWATQVLKTLSKKGIISRPEITDAAMAVRAECVMLNKGRFISSAISVLRSILNRMEAHQYKKMARLRKLHW